MHMLHRMTLIKIWVKDLIWRLISKYWQTRNQNTLISIVSVYIRFQPNLNVPNKIGGLQQPNLLWNSLDEVISATGCSQSPCLYPSNCVLTYAPLHDHMPLLQCSLNPLNLINLRRVPPTANHWPSPSGVTDRRTVKRFNTSLHVLSVQRIIQHANSPIMDQTEYDWQVPSSFWNVKSLPNKNQ